MTGLEQEPAIPLPFATRLLSLKAVSRRSTASVVVQSQAAIRCTSPVQPPEVPVRSQLAADRERAR